jgi:hypothetical protein
VSQVWKNHERQTAKALGGKRNSRGGDFSQSKSDVEHSLFSVECKYRAKLPYLLREGLSQAGRYDENKVPILVVKQKNSRGALVVLKMKDFTNLFGALPEQPPWNSTHD